MCRDKLRYDTASLRLPRRWSDITNHTTEKWTTSTTGFKRDSRSTRSLHRVSAMETFGLIMLCSTQWSLALWLCWIGSCARLTILSLILLSSRALIFDKSKEQSWTANEYFPVCVLCVSIPRHSSLCKRARFWGCQPAMTLIETHSSKTSYRVAKLHPRLDQTQAEDQAGFWSSYQTTAYLATYRMVDQKCHEWRIKMWIATIDFTKTFDSITHKSIWNVLKSCNIEHDYIRLLKKLYRDQKATVLTDEESDMFEIKRDQATWSVIKLTLQRSSAESIGKRHPALTKEEWNGNIPERQRARLPHKHEICWRRALACILKRTAPRNVMRIQAKYRKGGTQNPSRKDKHFQKARISEKK